MTDDRNHTADVEVQPGPVEPPTDQEIEEIRSQLGHDPGTEVMDEKREHDEKPPEPPKKKRRIRKVPQARPELTKDKVLAGLEDLGGDASIQDLTIELLGRYDSKARGRVYYHAKRLAQDGRIRQTGEGTGMRYVATGKPAKAEKAETSSGNSEVGLGDLFETVGQIGDVVAVRSLDTHQLYKLEKL